MLVTSKNFQLAIEELKSQSEISLDTETTGLFPYKGDRLFSIICATQYDTYYFNFNRFGSYDEELVLSHALLVRGFSDLLSNDKLLVFLANAKFDMHMLSVEGVEFKARPWDVLTIAKTLNNTYMQYGLDAVAKREGFEKLDSVEKYIKENNLFDDKKNPRYDWVPLNVIQPYGEADARITFDIGKNQQEKVKIIAMDAAQNNQPSFYDLIQREIETTEVCFEIEKTGMRIDEDFIRKGIEHEKARTERARTSFMDLCGRELVDSNKALAGAFGSLGLVGGKTKKGNASFNKASLNQIRHPLGDVVRDYRDAIKRVSSYYTNFLSYADFGGIVHPNLKQAGAKTFRFSVTDPALQTLEKPDDDLEIPLEDQMRNSFVARHGSFLVAIDYKQQEYRLTADYAGEMALIHKIMEGEDVHTATAKLMGVTRQQAKTLNFMLLYGGGVAKLCLALMKPLGSEMQLKAITKKYIYKSTFIPSKHQELIDALATVTQELIDHDLPLLKEAHALQQKYFSSLPHTKNLIDRVQKSILRKGYIYNWAGRRLHFNDLRFAYKGPNYLIQSSGAEIMRGALIELRKFLKPYQTKILLSIHDEILFEMPECEFHLIPEIQKIMVNIYKPINGCYMDTDVKWGTAWGSLKKGVPVAA